MANIISSLLSPNIAMESQIRMEGLKSVEHDVGLAEWWPPILMLAKYLGKDLFISVGEFRSPTS